MVSVSVVIPTRARAPLLARCLAALAVQSLAAHDYEIIVVGDGDDARTRDDRNGGRGHGRAPQVHCNARNARPGRGP